MRSAMRATIDYEEAPGRRIRIFTSVSTTSPATGPSRPGRPPVREPSSASTAARSSRFRRTTPCPSVPAAAAPPSAATRSSSRCRSTASRPPNSPSRRPRTPPDWLREARAMLPGPGRYLACREEADDEIQVFPIEEGWTRIGRSVAADIRLDDPSVSRRHALIVSEAPTALRVLDDRSLNGVFLNGERDRVGQARRRRRADDRPLPPLRARSLSRPPAGSGHPAALAFGTMSARVRPRRSRPSRRAPASTRRSSACASASRRCSPSRASGDDALRRELDAAARRDPPLRQAPGPQEREAHRRSGSASSSGASTRSSRTAKTPSGASTPTPKRCSTACCARSAPSPTS